MRLEKVALHDITTNHYRCGCRGVREMLAWLRDGNAHDVPENVKIK